MKRAAWCLPLMLGAVALGGCKKNFPEPYDQFGFSRDELVTAFKDDHGVTGTYSSKANLDDVIADWKKQLEAKGYKQFCEIKFPDKSVARGFKSDKGRYLFTGGNLGKDMPDLHLSEIPDNVPESEICVDPDKK